MKLEIIRLYNRIMVEIPEERVDEVDIFTKYEGKYYVDAIAFFGEILNLPVNNVTVSTYDYKKVNGEWKSIELKNPRMTLWLDRESLKSSELSTLINTIGTFTLKTEEEYEEEGPSGYHKLTIIFEMA